MHRGRGIHGLRKIHGLQSLFASPRGRAVALPARLGRLYGKLRLESPRAGPHVISNLVATLDGVVSLGIAGHEGGGDISGFSAEDRMVMGLLRATADVVVVGGGSLGGDPERLWTPAAICPELASDYGRLSETLYGGRPALRVAVSASGVLDLRSAAFASGDAPLLIATSQAGARRLSRQKKLPDHLEVRAVGRGRVLAAGAILDAVSHLVSPERVLVEGGPRLLGGFHASRLIDEQFLTLAPQLAGREADDGRIGLIMGRHFAPADPRWATLSDVRRSASHLFLRYRFDRRLG